MPVKLTPAFPKDKKRSKKKGKKKVTLTPALGPKPEKEEDDTVQTIKDGAYGVAQGAAFNLADEGYGAIKAALESGGGGREFSEAYRDYRDEARDEWNAAKKRSPVVALGGEIAGAVVSPLGNKILSAGKGLKMMGKAAMEGGAQAYGATEKESLKDQLIDTGLGAAVGGATGLVANVATKGWSKSPNATRAEVLGTRARDYLVDGPGDRRSAIQALADSGMFKNRRMSFNPKTMKFETNRSALDSLEKNTEHTLLDRATEAIEKLQQRKDAEFGPLLDNRFVPQSKIKTMVKEIAEEYAGRGLARGPFDRVKDAAKLEKNILDQIMFQGGDVSKMSLRQLDGLKRMAQEDVRNFSKSLGDLGDKDELARITARKLKELVENNIGTSRFKEVNSAQHNFLSVADDIRDKIRRMDLAAPDRPQLEKTNMFEPLVNSMLGGSQGRLDRAARKEWIDKYIPKPVRTVVPYAAEETPGAIYRQQVMPKNDRDPMANVDNIPEQLIRTPLPRTTEGLMEKKPFVLAKVAQMAPEMFESVKDIYDHNPEQLGEVSQVLAMKMPHFFERDKFDRFDGRVMSEKGKALAIKDITGNEALNSIEQGKLITKLNKTGEYLG